jgi:hypothetical protein
MSLYSLVQPALQNRLRRLPSAFCAAAQAAALCTCFGYRFAVLPDGCPGDLDGRVKRRVAELGWVLWELLQL